MIEGDANPSDVLHDSTHTLNNIPMQTTGLPGQCETSFDSGYTSSPSHLFTAGLSPLAGTRHFSPQAMSDKKKFIPCDFKSPQKQGLTSAMPNDLQISPLRKNTATFSPFKDSTLSPFKGTFDEWDKDFLAGFEENLLGMNELPESTIEELLKSPVGKALLDRRKDSPKRSAVPNFAVRRLRISPRGKTATDTGPNNLQRIPAQEGFQTRAMHGYPVMHVKQEPMEATQTGIYVKQEPIEYEADLYGFSPVSGQTLGTQCVNVNNVLTVTDPNKMSATPIKPKYTCIEKTAPKRKLSMKIPGEEPTMEIIEKIVQLPRPAEKENITMHHAVEIHEMWPPKERLKFARTQFKLILDKAVNDSAMKYAALKREQKPKVSNRMSQHKSSKSTSGKHGKNTKPNKNKTKKGSKKDKYPQIKLALGTTSNNNGGANKSSLPAPQSLSKSYDPGWYPSDDDTESWQGPPPFNRQMSSGFYDESDEEGGSWDEEFWLGASQNSVQQCERSGKRKKY